MLPPQPAIVDPPPLDRASLDATAPGFRYFNVAGSGPTMPIARRAMEDFGRWLDSVGMFSHVGYDAYNEVLSATRADLARAIGDPGGASRVALMQSATAALNAVVGGLRLPRGARVVTTDQEHAAALLPIFARRERGDEVVVVPFEGDDARFVDRLREAVRPGGALLLSHVSHRHGVVLPVAQSCALARERGAFAIVDGAQALGQVPVDVRAMGVDAYCLLGHKWLHGPLATGGLWLREPTDPRLVPPVLGWRSRESSDVAGNVVLKSSAERFESGTVDAAAFVGLRQALAAHRALGIARIEERVVALRRRVCAGLAEVPVRLLSRAEDPTGIVTFEPGADVSSLVKRSWDERRVVIKALTEPEAVRVSFWYLHEDAAVDDLLETLHALLPLPARS